MADLGRHIQHFKAKAYYKSSNYQRSIKAHQEKVYISEEIMEAEREDGRQNIHFLAEELS